jgi:hypothetical protein
MNLGDARFPQNAKDRRTTRSGTEPTTFSELLVNVRNRLQAPVAVIDGVELAGKIFTNLGAGR